MAKLRLKPDSLALSLHGAAQAVALVLEGTALPPALARVAQSLGLSDAARGAQQDIAYRSMRRWGRASALLRQLATRTPQPQLLLSLICCSLAQLCEDDGSDRPYTDFTLVDQAVAAAAADPKLAHAKGMVNAILRRFLRERDSLLAAVMQDPVARWNYPLWWIQRVQAAYPNAWQTILEAGNARPPLTLRVNRRHASAAAYLQELAAHNIAGRKIGADAVQLEQPMPVQAIPGFTQGWVSVQDAGAQLAAPMLDAQDGMRVLDACAAPGGKTGHLLECADIDLLALDADGERLQRITQNLQRLQLSAHLLQADASRADWWDGQPFDRILADVPCTASGVVRRHPDIRWLRRPDDAARLATLSCQILDNLWRMVKPDGKLLLVTCSLWPEESEMQAQAFASRHGAIRLAAPGQLLPGASGELDQDGLFYALFQKPPA
ncbi:16S rRNA (cytosine(967)-C(5))-methyltransferase RsmB [Janthinobacterium sp. 17J80-10]|uniref:16S rRNA (cytosine(967)-C(5))-methyltransferase RsmB n=1 Tax=Janthinobacterium sp. 17J80-10 TaxID=2497863 RepID=UPI0010055930|nr:16S rRNA (cytosine(967)-C(5))-methyltransferase RsmB [Janthinobacterium sp. 17J80-10]QAU33158.1 16S rRNA (cytosine(967)-C(5))-methyltransferase RsmB [Janthinobacterium sp. 17J80-10]